MSSSSQQHCRSGKYRDLMNFTKVHHDHLSFSKRKTDTHNLKISVNSYMDRTKISNQEFSAVRQMMKAVNYRVLEIKNQIRKNGLHSILFDNTNNKTDKKQILGVILDARNHFARQKNSNRRYITFSSGLNESSGTFTQSESLEGGYRNFSGFRFKKINFCFAALLVFALCFCISCGSGKSDSKTGSLYEKCYPNETCDKGLICDTENNVCIKDPDYHGDENNNDTDSTIDNNDGNEQPIDNNDSDDVIDDNDTDDQPIDNDDTDDVIDDSDVNDNDSIENNDNDDNPSEHDDSDNTSDSNGLFASDCVKTKAQLENLTQDQLDNIKNQEHDKVKQMCPYNYTRQPEIYSESGSLCIVDKCEGNLEGSMWLENAAPKIIFDRYGVPPPEAHKIVSMTVNYSSNGSQSNMKIRVNNLMMDVNFVSQSCLSQADENTSTIEMYPDAYNPYAGCRIDGEFKTTPIETKGTKQTRTLPSKHASLCKSMPNYQLVEEDNACYTTIDEFVWLENVTHKLLPKNTTSSSNYWFGQPFTVKSITRDLDTGVFHMTLQIGALSGSNDHMYVYVTLNNAKSCMDQCHGKEGCTSHIEPTQDASKGCFINGVEVEG